MYPIELTAQRDGEGGVLSPPRAEEQRLAAQRRTTLEDNALKRAFSLRPLQAHHRLLAQPNATPLEPQALRSA